MSVCKAPSRLLCGTSPPREVTVTQEMIGRAQISHDDGREQLSVCSSDARTTQHREVHLCSGKLDMNICPHLVLFHT